jgi:aldehyde:ferredoxin oxidoreductase
MISPEILGVPEKLDPQMLKGKPQWVKIFQDLTAVIDALGFCLFTSFAYGADDYREMLNAATGFNLTTEEVMKQRYAAGHHGRKTGYGRRKLCKGDRISIPRL